MIRWHDINEGDEITHATDPITAVVLAKGDSSSGRWLVAQRPGYMPLNILFPRTGGPIHEWSAKPLVDPDVVWCTDPSGDRIFQPTSWTDEHFPEWPRFRITATEPVRQMRPKENP